MTAATDLPASTEATFAAAERAMAFIRNNRPRLLGQIIGIDAGPSYKGPHAAVHIDKTADPIGSLIAWFYVMDGSYVRVYGGDEPNIAIFGKAGGVDVQAFVGHYDATVSAYLNSLDEVTVHSLRRVQVSDMPEAVAA